MSAQKKAASSYPAHGQIRVANGLTADEKLLLHTVASHRKEVSWGTRETLLRWTGLSERRFRRARKGALEKGVLVETLKPGRASMYKIGYAALKRLAVSGERNASSTTRRGAVAEVTDNTVTTVVDTRDHIEQALRPARTPWDFSTPTPLRVVLLRRRIRG